MAALNCSASLLGLSKTEVDVFVVINCPFGWGRGTRQSEIVLENDSFPVDRGFAAWDQ